jgi:hypothetical protein
MAYLKYCRDVIFAGERLTTDEEQLRDYFWELYKKASEKVLYPQFPSNLSCFQAQKVSKSSMIEAQLHEAM